jgi:hypothetical protein
VNRTKSRLARLGIRNFKPTLRKPAERLVTVHIPEGRFEQLKVLHDGLDADKGDSFPKNVKHIFGSVRGQRAEVGREARLRPATFVHPDSPS